MKVNLTRLKLGKKAECAKETANCVGAERGGERSRKTAERNENAGAVIENDYGSPRIIDRSWNEREGVGREWLTY
jgi:hypothetical protein